MQRWLQRGPPPVCHCPGAADGLLASCPNAGGLPGAMSSARGSRCQRCLPSGSLPPSLLQQLSPGRAPRGVLRRDERRQGEGREQLGERLSTARPQRAGLPQGETE